MGEALVDVLLLSIASHGTDDWLLLHAETEFVIVELPDPRGALEAVHKGHVAVHQDEAELWAHAVLLSLDVFLDDLQSLLSVEGTLL